MIPAIDKDRDAQELPVCHFSKKGNLLTPDRISTHRSPPCRQVNGQLIAQSWFLRADNFLLPKCTLGLATAEVLLNLRCVV